MEAYIPAEEEVHGMDVRVDRDTAMDALAADLERLGLVETYTEDDGRIAYRLTADGSAVMRGLSLTGDTGVLHGLVPDEGA